jgi:hypothetical protein
MVLWSPYLDGVASVFCQLNDFILGYYGDDKIRIFFIHSRLCVFILGGICILDYRIGSGF